MSIIIGNNERESWWVTNRTSKMLLIGDLPDVPSIYSGKRLDLLAHTTKDEIAKSKILANLIKSSKLSLNKQTSFTKANTSIPRNVAASEADASITPAEENSESYSFRLMVHEELACSGIMTVHQMNRGS